MSNQLFNEKMTKIDKKIKLKIATPERLILEEEVDQVSLPTKKGEITILLNHIPLVAELEFGELLAIKNKESIPFAIWGGLVEISNNQVIVLADVAEHADDVLNRFNKIEQAKKEAEDLMQKKGDYSEEEYEELLYSYQSQVARLNVAKKYKTKKYRKININK